LKRDIIISYNIYETQYLHEITSDVIEIKGPATENGISIDGIRRYLAEVEKQVVVTDEYIDVCGIRYDYTSVIDPCCVCLEIKDMIDLKWCAHEVCKDCFPAIKSCPMCRAGPEPAIEEVTEKKSKKSKKSVDGETPQ
jgi:hypothetical protein